MFESVERGAAVIPFLTQIMTAWQYGYFILLFIQQGRASCQGCSWHFCPRNGASFNLVERIPSVCFSLVSSMNSFGVRILNEWWEFCAVVGSENFSIVRRHLFSNICAFWREIRALPNIQSKRSYLLDKSPAKEGFSFTALPGNSHFLSRDLVKFVSWGPCHVPFSPRSSTQLFFSRFTPISLT